MGAALKSEAETSLAAATSEHGAVASAHDEALSALSAEHSVATAAANESHTAFMKDLDTKYMALNNIMTSNVSTHADELLRMEREHVGAIDAMKAENEAVILRTKSE